MLTAAPARNDQVRFDVSIRALAPQLKIEDPIRENHWSREEEIDYAKKMVLKFPLIKKVLIPLTKTYGDGLMNAEF